MTAQRLSHDELRRVLAVAQILRDIGATLVAELDTAQVMKTVTSAARKLTDATMGAFLSIDPDEPDGYLFVRAGSGRVRESSLGVSVPIDTPLLAAALAARRPVPRRRHDPARRIRRDARHAHAVDRAAVAQLHRDGRCAHAPATSRVR